jgi:hypothetical protein
MPLSQDACVALLNGKASVICRRPTRARHLIPCCGLSPQGWRKSGNPSYFGKLARVSGATINQRQADGNYSFPGSKTFYVSIDHVPRFVAERTYPFVSSYLPIHRAAGVRLFKVLQDNISSRRVELSTPAIRLIIGRAWRNLRCAGAAS